MRGLTRAQAERAFRKMQEAEEDTPRPLPGAHVPTVDEVIDSLRGRLELRGASKSYRENCEYMQRVHISPALGSRQAANVSTADVEVLARSLLKKGFADKSVRNMMGFLHSAFEHAIDRGLSRENPVQRAEKPGRLRGGGRGPAVSERQRA
jgi:site-specific recombinase XerC